MAFWAASSAGSLRVRLLMLLAKGLRMGVGFAGVDTSGPDLSTG